MSEIEHNHEVRRGYTAGCPGCQARVRAASARWRARHPETARRTANRYGAKRRAMIAELKLKSGCVDCGYNAHPDALDFDHIQGEKKGIVGRMVRSRLEDLMEEIGKCEVRCANCHRIKTAERRGVE